LIVLITSDKTEILEESQAELVTGAGELLPFNDCSFNTVLCYNVLDHTVDPDTVVEEAFRILNSGGEFVLMLNIHELPELIRSRLSVLDRPHPHHFNADELFSLLTKGGFQTEVAHHEQASLSDYALSQFTLKRVVASMLLRWERI
jgi:ubiquinone/menaquinone biosynthesis C-methylase UbiE